MEQKILMVELPLLLERNSATSNHERRTPNQWRQTVLELARESSASTEDLIPLILFCKFTSR